MRRTGAMIAILGPALGLGLMAGGAAQAQTWPQTWDHRAYDFHGQADRPGDFRCDAYWDRGRDDCDARWRDQRPFASVHAWRSYGRSHGRGYALQGYGEVGHGAGADAYHGAYGRPDLVYPGAGRRGYGPGYGRGYADPGDRDGRRVDWCRANYRSYDPVSGYYRAYSGRLIFCG